MQNLKKNNRGFTFVEIIVVVAIFAMTIEAIFALVWKNIYVQKHNEDFLVASMLAQEGLEMVRKIRDENWRDQNTLGFAWEDLVPVANDDFIIDYVGNMDPTLDDTDNDNDVTEQGNDFRLFINALGYYDHVAGGTPTKYYRMIKVDDDQSSDPESYVEFSAHVQWLEGGKKKEYIASTILYDWK